jgi:hypothetical protein
MAKAATSSLASKTSAVSGRHVSNVQVLYALAVVVVAVSSSHAHLFWARMRRESGCAEGARVGARRRGNGTSDNKTLTEYSPRPACDGGGTARLRGRPHRMLRARVVLDRAAAWTRLGVRVARRVRACVCARACVERVVGSIYNKQWKWPNV